jgi:hypothetical protein
MDVNMGIADSVNFLQTNNTTPCERPTSRPSPQPSLNSPSQPTNTDGQPPPIFISILQPAMENQKLSFSATFVPIAAPDGKLPSSYTLSIKLDGFLDDMRPTMQSLGFVVAQLPLALPQKIYQQFEYLSPNIYEASLTLASTNPTELTSIHFTLTFGVEKEISGHFCDVSIAISPNVGDSIRHKFAMSFSSSWREIDPPHVQQVSNSLKEVSPTNNIDPLSISTSDTHNPIVKAIMSFEYLSFIVMVPRTPWPRFQPIPKNTISQAFRSATRFEIDIPWSNMIGGDINNKKQPRYIFLQTVGPIQFLFNTFQEPGYETMCLFNRIPIVVKYLEFDIKTESTTHSFYQGRIYADLTQFWTVQIPSQRDHTFEISCAREVLLSDLLFLTHSGNNVQNLDTGDPIVKISVGDSLDLVDIENYPQIVAPFLFIDPEFRVSSPMQFSLEPALHFTTSSLFQISEAPAVLYPPARFTENTKLFTLPVPPSVVIPLSKYTFFTSEETKSNGQNFQFGTHPVQVSLSLSLPMHTNFGVQIAPFLLDLNKSGLTAADYNDVIDIYIEQIGNYTNSFHLSTTWQNNYQSIPIKLPRLAPNFSNQISTNFPADSAHIRFWMVHINFKARLKNLFDSSDFSANNIALYFFPADSPFYPLNPPPSPIVYKIEPFDISVYVPIEEYLLELNQQVKLRYEKNGKKKNVKRNSLPFYTLPRLLPQPYIPTNVNAAAISHNHLTNLPYNPHFIDFITNSTTIPSFTFYSLDSSSINHISLFLRGSWIWKLDSGPNPEIEHSHRDEPNMLPFLVTHSELSPLESDYKIICNNNPNIVCKASPMVMTTNAASFNITDVNGAAFKDLFNVQFTFLGKYVSKLPPESNPNTLATNRDVIVVSHVLTSGPSSEPLPDGFPRVHGLGISFKHNEDVTQIFSAYGWWPYEPVVPDPSWEFNLKWIIIIACGGVGALLIAIVVIFILKRKYFNYEDDEDEYDEDGVFYVTGTVDLASFLDLQSSRSALPTGAERLEEIENRIVKQLDQYIPPRYEDLEPLEPLQSSGTDSTN